jgi:hypothetical protein
MPNDTFISGLISHRYQPGTEYKFRVTAGSYFTFPITVAHKLWAHTARVRGYFGCHNTQRFWKENPWLLYLGANTKAKWIRYHNNMKIRVKNGLFNFCFASSAEPTSHLLYAHMSATYKENNKTWMRCFSTSETSTVSWIGREISKTSIRSNN